jgi:hypothetical protein
MRRHGGQAQGGTHADAMKGHLIDAIFHRAKASFRCVSGSLHLVRQLLNLRLQLIELDITICRNYIAMAVSSRLN